MAVLEHGLLKVEIKYFDGYEQNYSLEFSFDSRPLINPEVIGEGFGGYDNKGDLISVFEVALANDSPNLWKSGWSDLILEIRPFHKLGWKDQKEGFRAVPEYEESLKKVDQLRVELGGKIPDDKFELTFFVEAHGLKIPYPRDTCFQGEYVALRIIVIRKDLQHFMNTLKQEYEQYLKSVEKRV